MLATRIIPTLLCRGRQLVKGKQFNAWRTCGLALQAARIHGMRGVDELVLLDIGATPEGRGPDLKLIEELSESMHTPLAVGGGIRTITDVRAVLCAGADKVVIGMGAHSESTLISEAAKRFGRQAIVLAVDVQGGLVRGMGAGPKPSMWCSWLEHTGAGEIILTSVDREGMMTGYDCETLKKVCSMVQIPVIAHGGAGTYQHMVDAVHAGASAVAAGSLFQFTDATPAGAARYLHDAGIEVRLSEEEEHAPRVENVLFTGKRIEGPHEN